MPLSCKFRVKLHQFKKAHKSKSLKRKQCGLVVFSIPTLFYDHPVIQLMFEFTTFYFQVAQKKMINE